MLILRRAGWRRLSAALAGLLALFALCTDALAKSSGPDAGYAGNPAGNLNCTYCHNATGQGGTAPLSALSPVSLSVPGRYVPGIQTTLTITINTPQTSTNGFEVVPLSGTAIAGILAPNDTKTQVKSGYGMHTALGNSQSVWTMKWTPPAAGTGTVTFYAAGNATNDSNTNDAGDRISLATAQSVENLVPSTPTAQSPADGGLALTAPPSLVVNEATDGNGDALSYVFQLCADAACATVLETSGSIAPSGGTATWQPASSLTENTQYFWRAQAKDGYANGNGANSSVRSFWLDAVETPPGAVTFVHPVSDSTLNPGAAAFVVNATTDPDPGDVPVYDFVLATDAAFSAVVDFASGVTAAGGEASWMPTAALVEGTTYYLLAQARDTQGNLGPAAVSRFLAHANQPPVAPSVNAPADGAVVMAATVTLSANLSADPDPDTLDYRFQICLDAACAGVEASSPAVVTAPGATTVTWSTAATTENARRYWRARAYDGYVFGPYMTAASFYVDAVTEPPHAAVIQAPAFDGFSFNTLTPTLRVANGADPDPSAPTPVYDFFVFDDPARSNLAASALGLRDSGSATTWTVQPPLSDLTTYYLTVRTRDAEGNRVYTTSSFYVDTANTAPGAPANPSPSGTIVATQTPLLFAQPATDGEGDTLTYYFSLDTAPAFTGTLAQFSAALTWPAWTPPQALADRAYFWRVQAFDGGLYGPAADATFTVDAVNDPPGAPVPQSPLDGATVNTRLPALQAATATDPENDALVYVFEISLDAGFATLYRQSPPVSPSGSSVVWTPGTALPDTTAYYWRMQAKDAADAGVAGPYSGTFSFSIVNGNLPPDAPTTSDATQPVEQAVAFVADAARDPENDALVLNYEVYLDSNLGQQLAASGDLAPGEAFAPEAIPWTRGTYFWRVRANDGQYYGSWSRTAKLTLTTDRLPFETGAELPETRVTGVRVVETGAGGGCTTASPASFVGALLLPLLWLRRRGAAVLALALFVTACGADGPERTEVPVDEPAVYGYAEAQAIFDEHCIGCHFGDEGEAGLALDEEHAYESIVGVTPANEIAADRGMKRVDPGKPENSFLLYKISEPGLGEGERMPLKLTKLSDEEIEILRKWIAEGAKKAP